MSMDLKWLKISQQDMFTDKWNLIIYYFGAEYYPMLQANTKTFFQSQNTLRIKKFIKLVIKKFMVSYVMQLLMFLSQLNTFL